MSSLRVITPPLLLVPAGRLAGALCCWWAGWGGGCWPEVEEELPPEVGCLNSVGGLFGTDWGPLVLPTAGTLLLGGPIIDGWL